VEQIERNNVVVRKTNAKRGMAVSTLTKIALLSAVAGLLMLLEFPLWFAPSFYKLDLSELAVLIGALSMGPMAGAAIELVKILLNFVMNGTITGGVGEAANFLIGCSLVVPAAWIYQKQRGIKGMLLGMAVGTLVMTVLGALINYLVLLPVYAAVFGQPLEFFVQMGTVLNPAIVDLKTLVLYAVAPFNLLKGVLISVLAFLLYRRLGHHLEK